jgi:hypothetical protein
MNTDDIQKLLAAERDFPTTPADVRARVMARARDALAHPVARSHHHAPRVTGRLRFAAAAGLLLAGAGAFAGWQARGRVPPPPEPAPPPFIAPVAAPARPAQVSPEPATTPALAPPPLAAPTHVRARRDAVPDTEAELRLLRQAQEAVASGRFEAALVPLAEHARRFPGGRLVEEREALRIQSLSKLGRIAEARQAAQAFRARFPRSVLLPRVGEVPDARE